MSLRKSLIKLAYREPQLRSKLLPILASAVDPEYGTALDGKSKQQAVRIVNGILHKLSKGMFRDTYWKPVQDIRKAMEKLNIPFVLEVKNGGYEHNSQGVPTSKRWEVIVPFFNEKNRATYLYGAIVCSGAGSIEDPLEIYDVVAYVG